MSRGDAEQQVLVEKYTGLDSVLDRVGAQGKYQILTFIIFSLQWFCLSWLLTGGGFFFDDMEWDCTGFDFTTDQCTKWVCALPESQWPNYVPKDFPKIIANSFGTIYACNKDYVMTILSTMVYIGSFAGFFVFPHIADNKGRKPAVNAAWAAATIGVIIAAASQNIYMIGIGWFLAGFGGNPAITLSYSFINEQSLGKYRQYFSVGIQLSLAVGEAIIGFIFKHFQNWRPVNYILVGIFVFTGITQIYLLETPRFMIKKSLAKTLTIYNTIAKRNHKNEITMEDLTNALEEEPREQESKSSSLIDLFRYKSLRWTNLICGFIFFCIQLLYYSTNFNLDSVGFNPYTNQCIVGISEFFSYLFAEIMIPKVKRKPFSFAGMGFSAVFCFVLISVEGGRNKILSAALLCAMRFVLCSFWAIFYVYQAELFPTKVRSLSLGWSSAIGTIGSTMSPLTVKLAKNVFHMSSWIIPGSFALLATASIQPLRETFNVKLEDDIEEEKGATKQSLLISQSTDIDI